MAFVIDGAGKGTSWWDEEERKRKESLGIAGAPMPTKQGTPTTTPKLVADDEWAKRFREKQSDQGPKPITRSSSRRDVMASRASATDISSRRKPSDPISEFWTMAEMLGGQERLEKRLEEVGTIWATYLKPYSKDVIWDMARSPYTSENLEFMAKMGHLQMYGIGLEKEKVMAPDQWMLANGYDPSDPEERKMANFQIGAWGRYQTPPGTHRTPGVSLVDTMRNNGLLPKSWDDLFTQVDPRNYFGGEEGKKRLELGLALTPTGRVFKGAKYLVGGKAGTLLGLTGKATTVGKTLGAFAVAGEEYSKSEYMQQLAAEKPGPRLTTTAINQLNSIDLYLSRASVDDVKSMQTALSKDQFDSDGNLLQAAVYSGPIDGRIDSDFKRAIVKTVQNDMNMVVDDQRKLIELGFADKNLELTGDMKSPEWTAALESAQREWTAQEDAFVDNPRWAKFRETAGWPMTRDGATAFYRRLTEFGGLQGSMSSLLEVAIKAGSLYEAVGAAVTFGVRQANDPIAQQTWASLEDYVMSQRDKFEPFGIYRSAPTVSIRDIDGGYYAIRAVEDGFLKNDPKAIELLKAFKDREYAMLAEDYSFDTVSLVGNLLGIDPTKIDQTRKDNPDLIRAVNIGRDIGLMLTGMKMSMPKGVGQGYGTLPRDINVARMDQRIKRRAATIAADVQRYSNNATSIGLVETLFHGTDGGRAARRIADVMGGRDLRGDGFYRRVGDAVSGPVLSGDLKGAAETISKMTGASPEAAMTMAQDLAIQLPRGGKVKKPTKAPPPPEFDAWLDRSIPEKMSVNQPEPVARQAPWVGNEQWPDTVHPIPTDYAVKGLTGKPKTKNYEITLAEVRTAGIKEPINLVITSKGHVVMEEVWLDTTHGATKVGEKSAATRARKPQDVIHAARELGIQDIPMRVIKLDEGAAIPKGTVVDIKAIERAYEPTPIGGQKQLGRSKVKILQYDPAANGGMGAILVETRRGAQEWVTHDRVFTTSGGVDIYPLRRVKWEDVPGGGGTKRRQVAAEAHVEVQPQTGMPTPDQRLHSAKYLAARQKNLKDVVGDSEMVIGEEIARMWDQMYDIFPDLQSPKLKEVSPVWLGAKRAVMDIENPTARKFFTVVMSQFEKAPVKTTEFDGLSTSQNIEASVLVATGDYRIALEARGLWDNARTEMQREAIVKKYITKPVNDRFKIRASRESRDLAINVEPGTGAIHSEGMVLRATELRYKAQIGAAREALYAPFRTDIPMPALEKIMKKGLLNPYRVVLKPLKRASGFARAWTVAINPMLVQKHMITDTGRTIVENGPRTVIRSKKVGKDFESHRGELSPEASDALYSRINKIVMSEQMYDVAGNIAYDWGASALYKEVDGVLVAQNLTEGAQALRRFAQDPTFRALAEGGIPAVTKYLHTRDGRIFLKRSGVLGEARNAYPELKGSKLINKAIEDYIEAYVDGDIADLAAHAPRITDGLKSMSLNREVLTVKKIEDLIKEVNKDGVVENVYLSTPVSKQASFWQDTPSRIMGQSMRPNKWNRKVYFMDEFNKAYKELKKDGATADEAAKIASTVAELNVARVHFDLAQMYAVEARHRWAAWFMTKHRLYNTFLAKTAVKRPWVANSVMEMGRLLEDRNERNDVPEYDRHKLNFSIGGIDVGLNLAPYMWLTEYAAESGFGQVAEWAGAKVLSIIPGVDVKKDFGTFGLSFSRFDSLVKTFAVWTPAILSGGLLGDLTDDEVSSVYDALGSSVFGVKAQEHVARSTTMQRVYTSANGGDELTAGEAMKKAILMDFAYQAWLAFRPASARITFGGKSKYKDIGEKYGKATAEERSKILDDNPWFAESFGAAYIDPAKKLQIDKGWKFFNQILEERTNALIAADENGMINDKPTVDAILSKYNRSMDQLLDPDWMDGQGNPSEHYNQAFAEQWNDSGDSQIEKQIGLAFPTVDAHLIAREGYVPTQEQVDTRKADLKRDMVAYAKGLGIPEADLDRTEFAGWREFFVEEPIREYSKVEPTGLTTYYQENVARYLARGGEDGKMKAARYLGYAENQSRIAMLKKGLDTDSKDGVNNSAPIMAVLNREEKAMIGWNSSPETTGIWNNFLSQRYMVVRYARENKISDSTNLYKEMMAKVDSWAEQQAAKNPTFGKEWEYSKMPLTQRLRQTGIDRNSVSKTADGWDRFLDVVERYNDQLAQTPQVFFGKESKTKFGVGPTSGQAGKIVDPYLEELLVLREEEPEWWSEFNRTFSLTHFGFGAYRLPGGRDSVLFNDAGAYATEGTE